MEHIQLELFVYGTLAFGGSNPGILVGVLSKATFLIGRYSGTGGMIWGWLIAGLMTQFLAASIAELCSSLPTAVTDCFKNTH